MGDKDAYKLQDNFTIIHILKNIWWCSHPSLARRISFQWNFEFLFIVQTYKLCSSFRKTSLLYVTGWLLTWINFNHMLYCSHWLIGSHLACLGRLACVVAPWRTGGEPLRGARCTPARLPPGPACPLPPGPSAAARYGRRQRGARVAWAPMPDLRALSTAWVEASARASGTPVVAFAAPGSRRGWGARRRWPPCGRGGPPAVAFAAPGYPSCPAGPGGTHGRWEGEQERWRGRGRRQLANGARMEVREV